MTRLMPVLAAVAFLLLAAVAVLLGAQAYDAAQARTVTYRYIAEALTPVTQPESGVTWAPPTRPLVRPFTEVDEALVGRALGSAWRAHAAAGASGDTTLLADYFSGVAFDRATVSARAAKADGTGFAVLAQHAAPAFYHLDGSVLQIEAEVLAVRFAQADAALGALRLSRDTVTTILMNETTGWRVFAHEMTASTPLTPAPLRAVQPETLAGVNYYPAQTPWRAFWPAFDAGVIAADLARVAALGGNAVRIFLPADAFTPDGTGLRDLETFLDLARRHGLRVVPTLFDLRPGYAPSFWAADVAYLRRVLPVLAASGVVAFVDLKNEPDLDFAAHGPALVEAWLRTMAGVSRDIAPDLPLSVGWADASAAPRLADVLDVLSYHDYAPRADAAARLRAVRDVAGGKPVYVTEIGASSFTAAFGFPGSPDTQAQDLAARLDALSEADGVFVWTLHDFTTLDAAAIGGSPWAQRLQARFGLYDAAGTAKPAAAVVADAFATRRGH